MIEDDEEEWVEVLPSRAKRGKSMARYKAVKELSDEFKAAVAKEADRIGRETNNAASSTVLAKNVDLTLQLITGDVLDAWVKDMRAEAQDLQQYVKDVREDVEEKVGPLKALESAAEMQNSEFAQIANFYQQLIKVGSKSAPDASGNVVIREAAYIVWAALMRDGSSPPSDPDVKAEEKPVNVFNQRRR